MCGIVGIISANEDLEPRSSQVEDALLRLRHRGPDDSGLVALPRALIGSTRLAIIDPQHGRQPMRSADGRHVLTFNGEIVNHAELRRELMARGHRFESRSDTEG